MGNPWKMKRNLELYRVYGGLLSAQGTLVAPTTQIWILYDYHRNVIGSSFQGLVKDLGFTLVLLLKEASTD